MTVRIGAVVLALAIGAFAAGCGGSDGKSAEAEHTDTPQQAIAEIAKVRAGLATALATYKSGDKAAADQQVGDTYLEHFELVEGPLEKVDPVLMSSLEHGIRETLRDKVKAGAPAARIEQMIKQIDGRLDDAKAALQK